MFEILSLLPGKKRRTSKGWYSFNAVCCHHRGHKADKRSRGGIIYDGDVNWSYNCFNCGYKAKYVLGKTLAGATKQLLYWCGLDKDQINEWNLYSLKHKSLIDFTQPPKVKSKVHFNEVKLPEQSEFIDPENPAHTKFVDYIKTRGMEYDSYPFMITPNEGGRNSDRIIIPYTWNNKIVGYSSRFLDDRIPKYIKEQQTGYMFGYDFQQPNWEVCIVVEGLFDALCLNACALTHDTISEEQADLLKNLHRRIIVVPDQDKSGLAICDRALELGFQVSLPFWDDDIKDPNDAFLKYGKIPTLLSILQAATSSKIKIDMARRRLQKKINKDVNA